MRLITFVVVALCVSAVPVLAQGMICSTESIRGNWGVVCSGSITPAPGAPLTQMTALGTAKIDAAAPKPSKAKPILVALVEFGHLRPVIATTIALWRAGERRISNLGAIVVVLCLAVISELAIDSLMVELGPFFMAARARKKPRSAFFGVEDIVELV